MPLKAFLIKYWIEPYFCFSLQIYFVNILVVLSLRLIYAAFY